MSGILHPASVTSSFNIAQNKYAWHLREEAFLLPDQMNKVNGAEGRLIFKIASSRMIEHDERQCKLLKTN